jgi:hypothetical protein
MGICRYKSHTRQEVMKALQEGKKVYILDTGAAGQDDVLIGTREECVADTLAFFGLDELPEDWKLYLY